MYVSYVSNCKFISQNSVPTVNFMRKSLTELFSLNDVVSYNHAFLYIRQLAIHLRSAVITKKKVCIFHFLYVERRGKLSKLCDFAHL